MLFDIKNTPPAIDFGFGITQKTAATGQTVTVWLSTIYNREAYIFSLAATGAVTKVSDYEYEVTYNAPGTYNVQMTVSPRTKGRVLQSNVLNLNIV